MSVAEFDPDDSRSWESTEQVDQRDLVGEATSWSADESFDARPGNQTIRSTLIYSKNYKNIVEIDF